MTCQPHDPNKIGDLLKRQSEGRGQPQSQRLTGMTDSKDEVSDLAAFKCDKLRKVNNMSQHMIGAQGVSTMNGNKE